MKKYIYAFLGILFIFGVYIFIEYPEFQKKARESEAKLALQAFKTAEDSYFDGPKIVFEKVIINQSPLCRHGPTTRRGRF